MALLDKGTPQVGLRFGNSNVDPNANQRDDLLNVAKLKKKEVQSKNQRDRGLGLISYDTTGSTSK